MAAQARRRNLEATYLLGFKEIVSRSNVPQSCVWQGLGKANRFDPGFDLNEIQRFQFGDLRVELTDRIVIVELESGGGLTNLVKYWPLARRITLPVFLLHVFGQGSEYDYIAHLRLWDFTWRKMRADFSGDATARLLARRFTFYKDDLSTLGPALDAFRDSVVRPVHAVKESLFSS